MYKQKSNIMHTYKKPKHILLMQQSDKWKLILPKFVVLTFWGKTILSLLPYICLSNQSLRNIRTMRTLGIHNINQVLSHQRQITFFYSIANIQHCKWGTNTWHIDTYVSNIQVTLVTKIDMVHTLLATFQGEEEDIEQGTTNAQQETVEKWEVW